MKAKIFCILVFSLLLSSCNLITGEVTNWMNSDGAVTYPTKRHLLEEDDIKITLPADFERYSLYDYQQMLDSVTTKVQYRAEVNRIESLMEMEGNLYMYFDPVQGASYTINTLPYWLFTREEAQYILGTISEGLRRSTRFTDITVEKITGKYHSEKGRQTFKAIYKLQNETTGIHWFASTYFISENGKTVGVQLNTPYKINFDPMVAKMIF